MRQECNLGYQIRGPKSRPVSQNIVSCTQGPAASGAYALRHRLGRLRVPIEAPRRKTAALLPNTSRHLSSRRTNTDGNRRGSITAAVPDPGSQPAQDARRPVAARIRRAHFWNAAACAAASSPADRCNARRRGATDSCSRANDGGSPRGKSSGSDAASDRDCARPDRGEGKWRRNQLDLFAGAMAAWPSAVRALPQLA
jgi:hypothetical protein